MSQSIAHLSREEKIRLISLLEEKERRIAASSSKYPPHPGQRRVHESQADQRFVFCGNGFGKTALLVNELHWAATGFNSITKQQTLVPAKICLLIDSPEKIEDIVTEYRIWNTLSETQLHKRGKAHYSFITFENGSTITVLSHAVELLKLEGSNWSHLLCDEPPPKNVFDAIMRGGRIKGRRMKMLLCGTPITAAWMRLRIFEPWSKGELPHVECFTGDTDENMANLDAEAVERYFASLTDREREIRRHGAFHDLTGLALSHLFNSETHVVRRQEQESIEIVSAVVAMDPHPSKKSHACLMGVDRDNQLYVIRHMAEKLPARQYAAKLREFMVGYRVIDIVCDSLGSAQMTSGDGFKSWIAVLNEEGIRCRATTYLEKSDEDFISRIQDVLVIPDKPNTFGVQAPRLRVFEQCVEVITDIQNVQWLRDKHADDNKPKLDITNKDALSTVKYALSTGLYAAKGKERAFYRTGAAYGIDPQPKRQARRRAAQLPEDGPRRNPYLPRIVKTPWSRD